jgi:AraC-like DNA-binding protein
MHTHDTWDLMLLDDGVVDFALDRHQHDNGDPDRVILLPPGVPHDGRTVETHGFRKRVLYLDTSVLPADLADAAVDTPIHRDRDLRSQLSALHRVVARPGDEPEAEARLAFVHERLLLRLGRRAPTTGSPTPRVASSLRDLLDASPADSITLAQAGRMLGASPTHLVRAFRRTFGLPPHAYLIGRRIDCARKLLLDGLPIAEAATAAGFYDQAHLSRHFVRYLGIPPGKYATTPP